MPSHFTLRMQFGPHEDPDQVAQWLLDLTDRAPVDEVMVFFFGEELNTGHPTPEEIRYWIDRTRPWRQALTERGVALSLNIWQTLLHRDGARCAPARIGRLWSGNMESRPPPLCVHSIRAGALSMRTCSASSRRKVSASSG
jgi:hypothetical protein